MPFSNDQDVFDESRSWEWRVLRASHSTTTGLIVMAMLAKQPKNGPALGQTCDILVEAGCNHGNSCICKVVSPVRRYGTWWAPEVIGTVLSVRDNLRRLADHCKLKDADRIAMFSELQKWIRRDYRAKSEA